MKRKLVSLQFRIAGTNLVHTETIFKVVPNRHLKLSQVRKIPFQLAHKDTILEIFKQT